ncbi:deoxyribonuclease IV [Bacillus suaedaesalsae]|uniref:Deoxyribonuclease IV n=1 Tax=Bacillus suaedaesalsae TaxID=2810349 RepID=A0ABS2DP73_9BACI|nr:deoxyribonuclease IV [Bacillus suaedaesalsae]MBM6619436.1 deoxyribonuclease IV [Bacillus suaedaesalsae]
MLAGCHVSIRDGYLGAAKTAQQLGANAYQYFPKNPRSLSVKEYNSYDAKGCKDFCEEHSIISVAHTPYPTNLTPSDDKRKITIDSLLNDLEIAEACGSIGVVVHFGSQIDSYDPLKGYQVMIEMLNEVLRNWEGNALLLIENVAGKSGIMGTTLEEQVQVRSLCQFPNKIGFCLDTCHAFSSDVWTGEKHDEFIQKGIELSYFDHLKVIHLNNSKYENGSGMDRHANIDSGKIDINVFSQLLQEKKLRDLPFVLETPGEDHQTEISLIRTLQYSEG